MSSPYGSLFQIDDFASPGSARRLQRVELSGNKSSTGYDEAWLQRLLVSHPQALPIAAIESFMAEAVPVCLELGLNTNWIDLLLVTPHGDIVVVECKLWRNPQARREVIAQIIDYAKELARLCYEAFETAIRKAEPAAGLSRTDSLYQRSGAEAAGVGERSFIDTVSRNLRRGRFLLLIVGDGIQDSVQSIVEFLQQHAGMHFTLALVEVAIFKMHGDGYLVLPRVVMQTQMVPRGVVAIEDGRITVGPAPTAGNADAPESIPTTISEARLYETLDAKLRGGAHGVRRLGAALESIGGRLRFTQTLIVLEGLVSDQVTTLAKIDVNNAIVWFDGVVPQAAAFGCGEAALNYYHALASLVRNDALRAQKLRPNSKSGTATLPLDDLLTRQDDWLGAAKTYLGELRNQTQRGG